MRNSGKGIYRRFSKRLSLFNEADDDLKARHSLDSLPRISTQDHTEVVASNVYHRILVTIFNTSKSLHIKSRVLINEDRRLGEVHSCSFFLYRYWDTLLEMFWPRFTFVIQQNIESIRLVDPQKMGTIDVQPHYVSINYCKPCSI